MTVPILLSEYYDRRVAIEGVRDELQSLDMPYLAKGQIRLATRPEGRSDEEILVDLISDHVLVQPSLVARSFGH